MNTKPDELRTYHYIISNQQTDDDDASSLIRKILVKRCKEAGAVVEPDDLKVIRLNPPLRGMMEIRLKQRNKHQWSVLKGTECCGRFVLDENNEQWYFWTGDSDAILLDDHLEVITMKLREFNSKS